MTGHIANVLYDKNSDEWEMMMLPPLVAMGQVLGKPLWFCSPLAWRMDDNKAIAPLFWGENYFHALPLLLTWKDNYIAPPLFLSKVGEQRTAGLVWWGKDYLHVFPAFFSKQEDWIAPPLLTWKKGKDRGAGPVFWGEDHFHVIPAYFSSGNDWVAPPLISGKVGSARAVGPVW